MVWRTTVFPNGEPITVDEARLHLKIDSDITEDDALIAGLIRAARGKIESYTGKALLAQTRVVTLPYFPYAGMFIYGSAYSAAGWRRDRVELPGGEIQSITSVQYLDAAGTTQALTVTTDYIADTATRPAYIVPAYGKTWPATYDQPNTVTITYVCGWATPIEVPDEIKTALIMLVAHLYENRAAVTDKQAFDMPMGVEYLLADHRVIGFA